jgi:capsular polysaccharide transport system permease protein
MNVVTIDHETLREVTRGPRQKSWVVKHRWLALFVGLPTLLAIVYYGLIASPIYVSHSSFVIKSPSQKPTPSLSLANIVQTAGLSVGKEQTQEVLQYIRSRDALKDLEKQTDIRAKYSNRGADFLSRFPAPFHAASFENLHRYYGSMIGADLDPESGLAIVEVRAFTPEDAHEVNARLLDLSEALVNRLNQRAEGRAIAEARQRVLQAEERVRNARIELAEFRNQQELIDPGKQAQGVLEAKGKAKCRR